LQFNLATILLDAMYIYIFTALHGIQAQTSDEKGVRLYVSMSVCPSVKRVDCDTTEERSVQMFIPYERSFSLSDKNNAWWGFPFYLKFLGQPVPVEAISPYFKPILARSTSAVTPREKNSVNTNRKSTTRFPVSQRWSSYVAPKPRKRGSKTQNGRFGVTSHFAWRKSATNSMRKFGG